MSTEKSEADAGASPSADSDDPSTADSDVDETSGASPELRAQLELLQAENSRLRREYVRARQSRYRRTALGLVTVGIIAVAGGLALPGNQNVLFALGGSAVIAGVLTYYLTPEAFVTLSIGDALTQTLQNSYEALQSELNLAGDPVYVPLAEGATPPARLFIPQHQDATIPPTDALRDIIVVPETPAQRGVSLYPTGAELLAEFRNVTSRGAIPNDDPEAVFEQLADGLVEQFELAEQVTTTLEAKNRCVIAVSDSVSDGVVRLDHPIPSFLAVGAAVFLQEPTQIATEADAGDDYILECRWGDFTEESAETSDATSAPTAGAGAAGSASDSENLSANSDT